MQNIPLNIPKYLVPDVERLRTYFKQHDREHVAVFDIGTRGARLLVAPRKVPSFWVRGEFCLCGSTPMLGRDVDSRTRTIDLNSTSIQTVVRFMAALQAELRAHNVVEVHAIGTAIFRWLANRMEILDYIEAATGVRIEPISSPLEAELTLRSVWTILDKTEGVSTYIRDNDYVAVADQGGGSLEVSWLRWGDRKKERPAVESKRDDSLGTIALLNEFLSRGGEGQLVDPSKNRAKISVQTERVRQKASSTIQSWRSLLRTADVDDARIHLFGVGTAITKLAGVSGFNKHLKFVTADRMEAEISERAAAYDSSNQQILSLYKALNDIEGAGVGSFKDKHELQSDLTVIYGVPAFLEVTRAMGLRGLAVFGFGLIYGYYIWRFENTEPLPFIPSDESGPYVFVSYARKNALPVYREMYELHRRGYRLAYDAGILPSEDYAVAISRMLANCAAVVVYWTKESIASEEVRKEVLFAARRKLPIIQVFLEPLSLPDDYEFRLGLQQFVTRFDQPFERYIEVFEKALPAKTKKS